MRPIGGEFGDKPILETVVDGIERARRGWKRRGLCPSAEDDGGPSVDRPPGCFPDRPQVAPTNVEKASVPMDRSSFVTDRSASPLCVRSNAPDDVGKSADSVVPTMYVMPKRSTTACSPLSRTPSEADPPRYVLPRRIDPSGETWAANASTSPFCGAGGRGEVGGTRDDLRRHDLDLGARTRRFTPLEVSQRYIGVFEDDGSAIRGAWEIRHEGSAWKTDFELSYHRRA
jgi:hypothetical protein